jgi:hypothetical protein
MKGMILYMYVDDIELRNKYQQAIIKHNEKSFDDFSDAGFDLFVPSEIMLNTKLIGIDYGIKCEAYIEDDNISAAQNIVDTVNGALFADLIASIEQGEK